MKAEVFLGTELKLNIHIEQIGDLVADDYDFMVEMYCSAKRVKSFLKSELIRVDNSNFIVPLDTMEVGAGELKCKVTAYIPDGDFDDALRTEIALINTGIVISKSM